MNVTITNNGALPLRLASSASGKGIKSLAPGTAVLLNDDSLLFVVMADDAPSAAPAPKRRGRKPRTGTPAQPEHGAAAADAAG